MWIKPVNAKLLKIINLEKPETDWKKIYLANEWKIEYTQWLEMKSVPYSNESKYKQSEKRE